MKGFARRYRPQHHISVAHVQHGNIQLQARAQKRRNRQARLGCKRRVGYLKGDDFMLLFARTIRETVFIRVLPNGAR
jgi:hypothetical protein